MPCVITFAMVRSGRSNGVRSLSFPVSFRRRLALIASSFGAYVSRRKICIENAVVSKKNMSVGD